MDGEMSEPVELLPSVEALFARQTRVILAVERIEQAWSSKLDDLAHHERELRGIALRLSETTMKFFAARALAASVPTPARLVSLFAGAAVGAFAATWIWFSLHAHAAQAAMTLRP